MGQLDTDEVKHCPKKCIPNVFDNLGRQYSTLFCQNDTENQDCISKQIVEERIGSGCKKSCVQLEYIGELDLNMPYVDPEIDNCTDLWSDSEKCSFYYLEYTLSNADYISTVYREYYIERLNYFFFKFLSSLIFFFPS